jgi:hypothetical protein
MAFPITWIAEKLDALPQAIRIFHNTYDYWLMVIILSLCACMPLIKGLRKDEES